MLPDAATPASTRTVQPTREYRGMWTFAISGVFLVLALLVVLGGSGTLTSSGAFVGALLGTAVSLIEARGLFQRRDWARYAMTPMLWIHVGAGVLVFLVALQRNSFNIPIGAILAAWALTARPSEALGPVAASSSEGTYLVIGLIVASVVQFL
jgi:hypothetical protein